jgi:hypothetical protein
VEANKYPQATEPLFYFSHFMPDILVTFPDKKTADNLLHSKEAGGFFTEAQHRRNRKYIASHDT